MRGKHEFMTIVHRTPRAGRANRVSGHRPARAGGYWRLVAAAGLVLGCLVLSPAPAPAQTVADGIAAFRQGDYRAARDIWQPLAEAGNPVAQFNLGKLYEYGGGEVGQDYPQAARWYQKAADHDIAEAQNNLGLMYAQGFGVPRDSRRAAELWQQAADANYSLAQYNLALAYFRGEGVDRDARQAVIWFEQAALAGLPDAQYAMGQLLRLGRAGPRDEGQALTWYQRAAAQGHAEAAAQAETLKGQGVAAKDPVPIGPARAVAAAPPEPDSQPPSESAVPGGDMASEATANEDGTDKDVAIDVAPTEGLASVPDEAAAGSAGGAVVPVPDAEPEPPAAEQAAALPLSEAAAAPEEAGSDAGGERASQPETEYRLWLVSADSESAAEDLRDQTLARHGAALGEVKLDIYEMDYGERGHFYRVLAGPLYSADAANDLCRRLREDDPEGFCKVLTR